ncbi:hypothetical protein BC936DRAFT_148884 [Jimgerdemannia flammicorona]|uniref:F-box domain-containing protein n=1 Tax=Jimgerdemannia flammicorona TaxID=994334 RepID=A0A433D229_9FUNG|nr:hypothetical protein BC936DRAFT_148884 [Jimgerdemannia flammicorona]
MEMTSWLVMTVSFKRFDALPIILPLTMQNTDQTILAPSSTQPASDPENLSQNPPVEVFRHILGYLRSDREITVVVQGNEQKHTMSMGLDDLLDLMATSMVCQNWYNIARPMISDNDLEDLFHMSGLTFNYSKKLRRFATLLSTARQLGLPYCDTVKDFEICLENFIGEPKHKKMESPEESIFDLLLSRMTNKTEECGEWDGLFDMLISSKAYEPDDHDALFAILRLTALKNLKLVIKAEENSKHANKREQFFIQLKQLCSRIPGLQLYFPEKVCAGQARQPPWDPQLASLIQTMQSSLTVIEVNHEPDTFTRSALSACSTVRDASFRFCNVQTAHTIVRGLPYLRRIELRSLYGQDAVALLEHLTSTYDLIEEIDITATPYPRISPAEEPKLKIALETLVSRCQRLKRLCLGYLSYMTEDILRAVARHCPDLEDLSLHHGPEITATGIWDDATPWPRIKYLFMTSSRIAPEFVHRLIEASDALVGVHLAITVGENRVVKEALERRGFLMEHGRADIWRRGEMDKWGYSLLRFSTAL